MGAVQVVQQQVGLVPEQLEARILGLAGGHLLHQVQAALQEAQRPVAVLLEPLAALLDGARGVLHLLPAAQPLQVRGGQ